MRKQSSRFWSIRLLPSRPLEHMTLTPLMRRVMEVEEATFAPHLKVAVPAMYRSLFRHPRPIEVYIA